MDDETYQTLVKERIPYFTARYKRKTVLQSRERLKEKIIPELLPELGLNKVFIFAVSANVAAIKKLLEGTTVRAVGLYEILFEE